MIRLPGIRHVVVPLMRMDAVNLERNPTAEPFETLFILVQIAGAFCGIRIPKSTAWRMPTMGLGGYS